MSDKSGLLVAAEKILEEIEEAIENDEEVDYGGRGSNPAECLGLAREFVDLVKRFETEDG